MQTVTSEEQSISAGRIGQNDIVTAAVTQGGAPAPGFSFGDAVFAGSTGGIRLARPVVALAAEPGIISTVDLFDRAVSAHSYQMPATLRPNYRASVWLRSEGTAA